MQPDPKIQRFQIAKAVVVALSSAGLRPITDEAYYQECADRAVKIADALMTALAKHK